jgi:hypothetical protein
LSPGVVSELDFSQVKRKKQRSSCIIDFCKPGRQSVMLLLELLQGVQQMVKTRWVVDKEKWPSRVRDALEEKSSRRRERHEMDKELSEIRA